MPLPESPSTTKLFYYENHHINPTAYSTLLKTWSLLNEEAWAQYLRRAGDHSPFFKHSLLRAWKDTGLFDSSLSKDVKMLELINKHSAIDTYL